MGEEGLFSLQSLSQVTLTPREIHRNILQTFQVESSRLVQEDKPELGNEINFCKYINKSSLQRDEAETYYHYSYPDRLKRISMHP